MQPLTVDIVQAKDMGWLSLIAGRNKHSGEMEALNEEVLMREACSSHDRSM